MNDKTESNSIFQLNQSTQNMAPSTDDMTNSMETLQPQQQKQQHMITVVPIDKDAPSSDNWYHGRLERLTSEERLKQANVPSAFLLRESERNVGSFVLSYLSLKSDVYHFKITAVYGDYYIGGRQFDRLETLISYYMFYSELVKGEKLLNPIAPPIVCKLERTYLSIKPYTSVSAHFKSNNSWSCSEDILYVNRPGERFRVFHEVDDGEWLWAQSYETGDCGLLAAECVVYIDDDRLHEIEPWYYQNITKEDVRVILTTVGNFSYLVRPSEQEPGNYTLFFNYAEVLHRYRITEAHDELNQPDANCTSSNKKATSFKCFRIGNRNFTSISSIIDRYMHEEIANGYRLSRSPHKRPEYYDQSINTFLRSYLTGNTNYSTNKKPGFSCLNKHHSFSHQKKLAPTLMNYKNCENIDNHYAIERKKSSPGDQNETQNLYVETSISGNEIKMRKNSFTEGLIKSSSISKTSTFNKLEQNPPSENSLIPAHNHNTTIQNIPTLEQQHQHQHKKLVSSKSISSPISGYAHNANNIESVRQSLKKKSCSMDQQLESALDQIGKQTQRTEKLLVRGYLNKFNEKTKKWKPYWFSLNQEDQQLFYFSNEKKIKEKGLMDLTYGFYYPLDDSFFNRSFCFQIIIHYDEVNSQTSANNFITHYLHADSFTSFTEWTEYIRPLCNPIQFNPFVATPNSNNSLTTNSFLSCLSILSSLSTSSASTCSSGSPAANSTTSSSHSSNSSSPVALNGNNIQHVNEHHKQSVKSSNSSSNNQNYRVLRTLSIDIHEARNVSFHPFFQYTSQQTQPNYHQQQQNPSPLQQQQASVDTSNLPVMPKFHKENMYYCLIMFNNEAYVASTQRSLCSTNSVHSGHTSTSSGASSSNNSKTTIWDDSFSFDNLPLDVREIKICLYCIAKPNTFSATFVVNNLKKIGSASKMLDPVLIGYVNIRLDESHINRGLIENWYTVEPMVQVPSLHGSIDTSSKNGQGQLGEVNGLANSSKSYSNSCTMRVKLRFCEERIQMNQDYYKELCDYLMDEREHKHFCTIYEQIVPSTERAHVVQALLRFFIVKNRIVEMLKSYLVTEIDRCTDLSTLFRPASMSTSLMDHYMRIRCSDFLYNALEDPLIRILRQNNSPSANGSNALTTSKSFELDPTKCPDADQRDQNLLNFKSALGELISAICGQQSVNLFPNELKYLFHLVRQHVHAKLQQQDVQATTDEKLVRIYCVSAFVFLRLLCPAIINPKTFGLKFHETYSSDSSTVPVNKKNILDYADLAVQFSVFSPSFIFSLSSHNSSTTSFHSQNKISRVPSNGFIASTIASNNPNTTNTCSSSTSSASQISVQMTTVFERHIKLLAKVLQTLANLTECKEPFMLPLSDFLKQNKPCVIKFIDEISNLNELSEAQVIRINDFYEEAGNAQTGNSDNSKIPERNNKTTTDYNEIHIQFENASCKYLAILNRLLNMHVPQMKAYLHEAASNVNNNGGQDSNEKPNGHKDKPQVDDSGFILSLQKLVNILTGINEPKK